MRTLLAAVLLAAVAAAQLPSPGRFLGHDIGEDHFLADYTQLAAYWQELAAASDRMRIESVGRTAYGQEQWLAVISSPENLARIDELRGIAARLTLGRDTDEAVARDLAAAGRAVIWIDAGMHATESVAAQNILELVWQMVSRDDAEVRRILAEVVLLVCPANPDGMELIADAYMATGRVGGIPVLYQKYVGHDNNRDHYAGNVAETRNILGALYRRWYPQVVYNHHQSAPRGTIIFTPPFRDPFNHNVDPLVVRGIDLVAAHMNHRFSAEGKPGVISRSGASYSTWWNGGLRTTVYFHNMVGILTEVFGSPTPTRVEQQLERRVPYSDYPDPIPTQAWHARQTIDYLQTANFAILDLAARYREEFLRNAWTMARRSIDRGSRDHWTPTPRLVAIQRERDLLRREGRTQGEEDLGAKVILDAFEDPQLRDARVYVLPSTQPDFAAATRLVRALRRNGIEVGRLTAEAELPDGTRAGAGSFVIAAAQAFRPHLRDMLEPQWHPDDVGVGGDPIRPYDSAGWTLSMQMGVEVLRVLDPVDLPTTPVEAVEVPFGGQFVDQGGLARAPAGWLVDHRCSNHFIAVNRLLRAGAEVYWTEQELRVADRPWPRGTVYVPSAEASAAVVTAAAAELGVHFVAVERAPAGAVRRLRPLRVGLFDVYGGHMPTGWTQWILEEWEFPVELVFGERIEAGGLQRDFDVLVFHTGLPPASRRGQRDRALRGAGEGVTNDPTFARLAAALPPFEDWSTMAARRVRISEERGVPALRAFVEEGGTLIALGDQASTLIAHFDLPLEEGTFVEDEGRRRPTTRNEFFVPGSLLRMEVAQADFVGYGVDPGQVAMFRSSPVFAPKPGVPAAGVVPVATWPTAEPLLASGWAIGTGYLHDRLAAARVPLGAGQVVLFGADVVYRGQPVGTFKLLFNAIQGGPSRVLAAVGGE
jgi:hypothetical protein